MSNTYLSVHYTSASCILDNRITGKRYTAGGGGYDRLGTVVGDWLEDNYQDRVKVLNTSEYYALRYQAAAVKGGAVVQPAHYFVDGGCGLSSVLAIAKAIGLEITPTFVEKGARAGERTGFLVIDALGA